MLEFPEISKQLILLPTAILRWTLTLFLAMLCLSHTLSLCLSGSLPFSPSFSLSIKTLVLCKIDYQLCDNKRLQTYKQVVSFWYPAYNIVKDHKIAQSSTTTKAGEKISTDLESVEFQKFFGVCLTEFLSNQILLIIKLSAYSYCQPSYLPGENFNQW